MMRKGLMTWPSCWGCVAAIVLALSDRLAVQRAAEGHVGARYQRDR